MIFEDDYRTIHDDGTITFTQEGLKEMMESLSLMRGQYVGITQQHLWIYSRVGETKKKGTPLLPDQLIMKPEESRALASNHNEHYLRMVDMLTPKP